MHRIHHILKMMNAGINHFKQGEFEDAESRFKQVLQLDSTRSCGKAMSVWPRATHMVPRFSTRKPITSTRTTSRKTISAAPSTSKVSSAPRQNFLDPRRPPRRSQTKKREKSIWTARCAYIINAAQLLCPVPFAYDLAASLGARMFLTDFWV